MAGSVRFFRCPKCRRVHSQGRDVPVYKCTGCGDNLRSLDLSLCPTFLSRSSLLSIWSLLFSLSFLFSPPFRSLSPSLQPISSFLSPLPPESPLSPLRFHLSLPALFPFSPSHESPVSSLSRLLLTLASVFRPRVRPGLLSIGEDGQKIYLYFPLLNQSTLSRHPSPFPLRGRHTGERSLSLPPCQERWKGDFRPLSGRARKGRVYFLSLSTPHQARWGGRYPPSLYPTARRVTREEKSPSLPLFLL